MQANLYKSTNNRGYKTHPDRRSVSIAARRVSAHLLGASVLAASLLMQTTPFAAAAPSSYDANAVRMTEVLPSTGAPAAAQYFAMTGKAVRGDFLNTFNKFGLQQIGYPLSDERVEGGRSVQYFERVRMEYHPEAAEAGYAVLMTRLGAELSKTAQPFSAVVPFKSTASKVYVTQTGHSLSEPFLSYWKGKGGVELYGYPISEPMKQDGMTVQWFERARFEYHPELAKSGQTVQLSLLGSAAYSQVAQSAAAQPTPATSATQPKPPAVTNDKVTGKGAAEKPAGVQLAPAEQYLLSQINAQRASAGLAPVTVAASVTDVARSRSKDMATRNYFSHTTPDGAQFFGMLSEHKIEYSYAGEILARNNYADDQAAQIAMTSYLNSAPHKAIMMDGRYNEVGIGYAKSGEDNMQYFTVLFVQQ